MEFPAGVLGVALGTILLPSLSKSFSGKDQKEYSGLLDWGLRLTFILAAPAAVALAVLSLPLIATLFHYGAFNMHDVLMTQQATIAYSFGLMGLIMIKVLAPGFYARQNIKTPVKIALFTLFSTQLMNMIFIGQFKHAGLALAIGLGACLNASLLYYHLRKGNYYKPHPGWGRFLIKLFVALVLMGLTLFYLKGDSSLWLEYSISKRLIYLLILILAGSVVYFGSLWMMGLRLQSFIRRVI
jgi:putative peptidoglycan lipid II flippase